MKTIVLPVPPGVRIGGAKTTVQIPIDAPMDPSSNATTTTRKRFLTLLRDGSGFCKYPKFGFDNWCKKLLALKNFFVNP